MLPLLLDDCVIPPILADIKYANARAVMERKLTELEQALFSNSEAHERVKVLTYSRGNLHEAYVLVGTD